MEGAYSFVRDVVAIENKVKRFEDTIIMIFQQTVECAIFVREYAGRGFAGEHLIKKQNATILMSITVRALRQMVDKERMNEFSQALDNLKDELNSEIGLHAALVLGNAARSVEDIGKASWASPWQL
jgi:hypothetical protein